MIYKLPACSWNVKNKEEKMNLKIITALALLAAAPAFAAGGICIVCPPGYDCSGPTPVLASGTTGQVLTRTETGTSWQALPAPAAMTWDSITGKPATFAPATHTHDYAPTTRKVAGLELSGDITAAQLKTALGL